MRCPFCGGEETRVVDSRLVGEGEQVRRRRACGTCRERFTTYESAELTLPRVIKEDGRRVPFSIEKVRIGVLRSLEKRPIGTDRVEALLARIERRLIASGDREVRSRTIGEQVMNELRELDQVAYVRFASVYRSFQDVDDFREEIDRLELEPTPEARRSQLSWLPKE